MALTTIDFVGEDLTGVSPITSGDLNNLVTLTIPKLDTNGDGKGLCLYSKDTAINTPVVPNAAAWADWKRYLWIRVPYLGQNQNQPLIYSWNDNATSDPILLKWVQLLVDISSLQAEIDAALAASQAAQAAANVALTTANIANGAAAIAVSDSSDALVAANTAANSAATASAAAASALSAATAASNAAAAATAAAAAKKDVNAAINPGTNGQRLRTNTAASGVEWFDEVNYYAKVSYSPAKNTIGESSAAADWVKRKIDTEDYDTGNLVSIATDIVTFALPGLYRIHIVATAADCALHKAVLVDTDTNLVLLTGTAEKKADDSDTSHSIIDGCITISATVKNLAVYHYTSVAGKLGNTAAVNIDYPKVAGVATKEVYLTFEAWKIN